MNEEGAVAHALDAMTGSITGPLSMTAAAGSAGYNWISVT